jgi:acetylornithine deacetylase/succinyl-diaminopimelate desuccinylase-like protein
MRNLISRDVRTSWLNANTAYQRLAVTQQLLDQAKLALELAQSRYKLGLGSIVELSQAQLQETQAEISSTQAGYDYRLSLAILAYETTGIRTVCPWARFGNGTRRIGRLQIKSAGPSPRFGPRVAMACGCPESALDERHRLRLFSRAMDRRTFLHGATAGVATLALQRISRADEHGLQPVWEQIEKQHDEAVARLQEWIRQPSIAAENKGVTEGCDLAMRFLHEAGFDATKIPTDGQPGIFATLDAGASRTLGLYFMYDVKQVDPSEWSSPPWAAALVEKPGLGTVVVGRGAVNQKGPEASFLAALHAIRAAGGKPPVNLVLVAEGEEEIGSPHFPQIVRRPEVIAALRRCNGIFMPSAEQELDGKVTMTLGAKGVIELELVSSGERWGRGPRHDIHSSNKARVDSPAWRLVEALVTLVSPDGNDPAIEGFADKARPLSSAERAMITEAARRLDERVAKKQLAVDHWVHDASWQEALERLMSRPTVNIEGLVGGYTGPGGKTILPHRAVAKLDLRLVPDMKAAEALASLKAHLAKRGFGDIEVNMTGGYDPNSTATDAALIRAQAAVYKRSGIDPIVLPRSAGSWPGYVFTDEPLRLAAGHFGLGHGSGAHAPDEYYVVESKNPKVQGMNGAVRSFVEYLYEIATT